jgi:uncharacterized protein YprB with RNaseH-like and TPR domain
MLRNTFRHIPGFSPQRERELWAQGVLTWVDLLKDPNLGEEAQSWLQNAQKAFLRGNADYFVDFLQNRDHWLLATSFPEEAMFLDIETTGFANSDEITIIGWSLGGSFKIFVNGRDKPENFLSDLARAKSLVTFNGRCFDARFIKKLFGQDILPKGHADLRYVCQDLGIKGGLKDIEAQLGLRRQTQTQDGAEAVRLWWRYKNGGASKQSRQEALRELIIYNYADVEGLKTIFNACLKRIKDEGRPVPRENLFDDLAVKLDFSDSDLFPFSLELI